MCSHEPAKASVTLLRDISDLIVFLDHKRNMQNYGPTLMDHVSLTSGPQMTFVFLLLFEIKSQHVTQASLGLMAILLPQLPDS